MGESTARPQMPKDTGNPRTYEQAMNRWRSERNEWKASADPVVVVDIDVPFGAVFRLVLFLTAASLIIGSVIGAAVLALLSYFGVL